VKSIRPPNIIRENHSSDFTAILRRIWETIPTVLVAAFVDAEGECVDYVSSLDPYEAKVNAADISSVMGALLDSKGKLGMGEPHTLEVSGDERELWARRIDDTYALVTVVFAGGDRLHLKKAMARAVREFRYEAGTSPPDWEPPADLIQVETRPATGWQYAPSAFYEEGIWFAVTDVLGRWVEPGQYSEQEKTCFRIRTEQGVELTLVYDPEADQWISRL
jgi:predicted regulator of Ras-like GTPase activity (Roadblock/LC7/MglB family)